MQYLFQLGSFPKLSLKEIDCLFPDLPKELLAEDILLAEIDKELDTGDLINKLGGTVKIAVLEKILSSKNNLYNEIVNIIIKYQSKKIVYGLSLFGKQPVFNFREACGEIKNLLSQKNLKSRFILPDAHVLTSVQVAKYRITEIMIINNGKNIFLGKTLSVQNFEEWNFRDYKRPFSNPKMGMLPPKIGRIMVNMAKEEVASNDNPVILDPFCGVGTIGAEALLSGFWVICSDILKDQVKKTEKNLNWICNSYGIPVENYHVLEKDAKNISNNLPGLSVSAIVTEPYLGPLVNLWRGKLVVDDRKLTQGKVESILLELNGLYRDCLLNWQKLLKPKAKIIIVFPSYVLDGREYFMKNIIDTCEKIGYNLLDGPFEYYRPQAVVKRNIYIFQKKE